MPEGRDHDLDLSIDNPAQAGGDHVADTGDVKWDENILPADDFSDDSNSEDDGEEPQVKSKSGLAIFAVVSVLALAGAGIAYTQFGIHQTPETSQNTTVATPLPAAREDLAAVSTSLPVIQDPQLGVDNHSSKDSASSVAPTANVTPSTAVAVDTPSLPKADEPGALSAAPLSEKSLESAAPQTDHLQTMSTVPGDVPSPGAVPTDVSTNAHSPSSNDSAPKAVSQGQGLPNAVIAGDQKSDQVKTQDLAALPDTIKAAPPTPMSVSSDNVQAVTATPAMPTTASKATEESAIVTKNAMDAPVAIQSETHPTIDDRQASTNSSVSPNEGKSAVEAKKKAAEPALSHAHKAIVAHNKTDKVATRTQQHKKLPHSRQSTNTRYELRSIVNDEAIISKVGDEDSIITVHIGDNIPGIGMIKSITQSHDGHWVLVGSRGKIY